MGSFTRSRPWWTASRDTNVTPSSVLRRVPPHQPAPPRPFWLRLMPRKNRARAAADHNRRRAPPPQSEEVIFDSTIIAPELAEEPPARTRAPLKQGLLRLSASLPSMSRRHQTRQILTDIMASNNPGEEEEKDEEENPPAESNHSSTEASSTIIQVLPATRDRSRDRSPASVPPPTRPFASDNPEQTFRLRLNVEPALTTLGEQYAGRIIRRTTERIHVQEVLANRLTVPSYIGKLNGWYTEIESREIFRAMCKIVQTLHRKWTVHRNLHLNQFLVHPTTGEFSIRGMFDAAYLESYSFDSGRYTEKPILTDTKKSRRYDWFAFRSPELDTYEVSPRHGAPADIWSLGVCLYTLLTGLPPFRGSGRSLRHSKMTAQAAPYDIITPSEGAQDLIARMIVVNPLCRLTIQEVLDHPWMQNSFATDVDLSLTQTLFMDWDNRSPGRRKRRHSARRSAAPQGTAESNTSSLIIVGGN